MIPLSREQQLQRWRGQYDYSRKHAIKLFGDTLPKPTGQAPAVRSRATTQSAKPRHAWMAPPPRNSMGNAWSQRCRTIRNTSAASCVLRSRSKERFGMNTASDFWRLTV